MFSRHLTQKIPSTLLARSTALGRTAYPRPPKFCRLNEPRLDVRRQLWSTPRRHGAHEQSTPYAPPLPASPASATPPQSNVAIETQEPRLSLTFTCTVTDCGARSTHEFTKRSYQRGIVIVQCPGCENRHLIADHLGWFKESTEGGKLKTVEDLMRAKGEAVQRGRIDAGGVIEYTPEDS